MENLLAGVRMVRRRHYHHQQWESEESQVVEEVPVTLFVNGKEYVTVALTPIDLQDWTIGFLSGENVIDTPHDLTWYHWREEDGQIWVRVPDYQVQLPESRYLGSCCGQSRPGFFNPEGVAPLRHTSLINLKDLQLTFSQLSHWTHTQNSGGLHAAGIIQEGELLLARADVGRHNALDKVYGAALMDPRIQWQYSTILFSGRLSAEIVWKVRRMGISVIASNAAPTSLGIKLADQLGITAIGFLRENELSVFTHPDRIPSAISPTVP